MKTDVKMSGFFARKKNLDGTIFFAVVVSLSIWLDVPLRMGTFSRLISP
jgi:hypothetical protein